MTLKPASDLYNGLVFEAWCRSSDRRHPQIKSFLLPVIIFANEGVAPKNLDRACRSGVDWQFESHAGKISVCAMDCFQREQWKSNLPFRAVGH